MYLYGTTPTTSLYVINDFFSLLNKYFKIPIEEKPEWFKRFYVSLVRSIESDFSFEENVLEGYFDMGLPKRREYVSYYDAFEQTLKDLGLENSEWEGDLDVSQRVSFNYAPWGDGWGYERLDSTNDYYWFLVLFLQRMGSFSEYESMDVNKIFINLYESGNEDKFNIKWFEPLVNWIKSKQMMDEFSASKTSIKSLNLKGLNIEGFEPDDISAIPEYDVEEDYVNIKGNFYHRNKVMLAITASGGFAQALERQDLEPKLTNVARILGKNKKRKL